MGGGAFDGGVGFLPVAPDATHFGWQGQQVVRSPACTGTVSLAVGATAVCFGRFDGKLVCAGKIGSRTFGTSFVDVGAGEVDQVLISRNVSFGAGPAQGACVRSVASGHAMCLGNYNAQGQFGNGSTLAQAQFLTWGDMVPVKHLATGTWDQFCALDFQQGVRCAGLFFGMTPTLQTARSTLDRLWVTEFGTTSVDDVSTFRVSNSRSSCRVTAVGLECSMASVPSGTAGQVVDGFRFGPPGPNEARCWLDVRGRVFCTTGPHFELQPVLTLAADFDTTSLCAVYADRSVWCLGSNEEGKLGTGSMSPAITETQVAPPGSVEIVGCP